jgi:hypothetical protein
VGLVISGRGSTQRRRGGTHDVKTGTDGTDRLLAGN